jgi:ribonuclease P protein component
VGEQGEKLSRKERVRKREDLSRLVRQGIRHHSKQYTVIVARNELDCLRIAASVSRKVGTAAERNYEKRVVRECFRRVKETLPRGFDLLVIVKAKTEDFESSCGTLKGLFRRSLS